MTYPRIFSLFIICYSLGGFMPLLAQHAGPLKKVVIDAGHGGKDSGAVGKLAMEKDIVLAVSLQVGAYINEYLPDVEVIYTRNTDVFVPLKQRAQIANKADADLFISIHANAISNPKIVGAETFALGLHRTADNLEVAKKENSVIVLEDDYTTTYEGFDPNVSESYIIFELMQNIYLDQSIEMARLVQQQFSKRVGRRDRGVKQAGFLVLRETAMPGVLIELGFLSNKSEEKFMITKNGQELLASGVFRAFRDYKVAYDAKNGAGVIFRVQIGSSSKQLAKDDVIYQKFNNVIEYQSNGVYKYAVGATSNYKEIKELHAQVKKDVPDCFVIAFENGKRIDLNVARKKVK